MGDEKINAATLDAAPLADADGREHGDQSNRYGTEYDQDGIQYARLGHYPAAPQEYNDAEYVDQA